MYNNFPGLGLGKHPSHLLAWGLGQWNVVTSLPRKVFVSASLKSNSAAVTVKKGDVSQRTGSPGKAFLIKSGQRTSSVRRGNRLIVTGNPSKESLIRQNKASGEVRKPVVSGITENPDKNISIKQNQPGIATGNPQAEEE